MKKGQTKSDAGDSGEAPAYKVRLPGFIATQDVGLGTVIKRATSAMGIKPCDGCTRRAVALNRWMVFSCNRRKQQ